MKKMEHGEYLIQIQNPLCHKWFACVDDLKMNNNIFYGMMLLSLGTSSYQSDHFK